MNILKSIFGGSKPVYDPALGDRLATIIYREARRGTIDTALKEVELLREGEWDRRAFYIDLIGEYLNNHKRQEELFPDTALGNLLKGAHGITNAWKARGGGTADTVSELGWHLFFKQLEAAGKSFLRAAEQDPEDPTPFAFLQTVAMGLQLEREIADDWFQRAVRLDPTNQQAHYGHLFLLCEKWGGSHDEMYAFARATMSTQPPTSLLRCIIYLAFQEHFLYLLAFDKDTEKLNAFLRDQAVLEESVSVYRSTLHRRPKITRVSDYWPHNLAAWWFYELGIPAIVRLETKKIGPYFTKYPWSMFFHSDPAGAYHKASRL